MKAMYKGDERYSKIGVTMDLLGIKDVSTTKQEKNGTIVWRLPIKNNHKPTSFIEVASFSTGYVRNQNSGYSNYQLNKRCDSKPQYYKSVNKNGDYDKDWCDRPLYTQYTTRSCKLIPIEIDRLEYLISYCLKNYFIKRANQVVEGKYVSQWYHDWSMERANETYSENTGAMARINDLEEKLDAMTEARDYYMEKHKILEDYEIKVKDLEGTLAATEVRQDVSVIVNGHRYKVI